MRSKSVFLVFLVLLITFLFFMATAFAQQKAMDTKKAAEHCMKGGVPLAPKSREACIKGGGILGQGNGAENARRSFWKKQGRDGRPVWEEQANAG